MSIMRIPAYLKDITEEAAAGLLNEPIGRDTEVTQIFSLLSQEGKSNVLLLGPAGVGKTAVVEGIAIKMVNNEVPDGLSKNKIYELDVAAIISGTIYRGEFEQHVKEFISFAKNHIEAIIFIDEIHTVIGLGRTSDSGGSGDMSQMLKPSLARGEFACIGATTTDEYNRYIASDGAFARRFHSINLVPVSGMDLFYIVKRAAIKSGLKYGIELTDASLNNIIQISNELYPERNQPDKSLDLVKRIIAYYSAQNIKKDSDSNVKLSDYADYLKSESQLIKMEQYEKLGEMAMEWLGVRKDNISQVNIGRQAIEKIINV